MRKSRERVFESDFGFVTFVVLQQVGSDVGKKDAFLDPIYFTLVTGVH